MKLKCNNCHEQWECRDRNCLKCGQVMVEMQGPERHLVGESRSATRPDDVEETKSGRRGVGEIVGAPELREYVDSELSEARRMEVSYTASENNEAACYMHGRVAALLDLQGWLYCRTAKRSDLSNV